MTPVAISFTELEEMATLLNLTPIEVLDTIVEEILNKEYETTKDF